MGLLNHKFPDPPHDPQEGLGIALAQHIQDFLHLPVGLGFLLPEGIFSLVREMHDHLPPVHGIVDPLYIAFFFQAIERIGNPRRRQIQLAAQLSGRGLILFIDQIAQLLSCMRAQGLDV